MSMSVSSFLTHGYNYSLWMFGIPLHLTSPFSLLFPEAMPQKEGGSLEMGLFLISSKGSRGRPERVRSSSQDFDTHRQPMGTFVFRSMWLRKPGSPRVASLCCLQAGGDNSP